MKLKDRIKTYSFWVSLTSAIILIVKLIAQKYGFAIDELFISDLVTTICGLLVILGIIVIPKADVKTNISQENFITNLDESKKETDEISNQIILDNCDCSTKEPQESEIIEIASVENEIEIPENDNIYHDEIIIEPNETLNNIEIIKPNIIENEIKNHICNILTLDKNNYSNNFSLYKKILIDEINKIDE